MKALSIRTPWTGCIIGHGKRVENRPKLTHYRGVILIHASKTFTRDDNDYVETAYGIQCRGEIFRTGGIVGVTEILECDEMTNDDLHNRWAIGPYLWRLGRVAALKFHPCKGQLSMFDVDYPHIEELPDWAVAI